MPYSDDKYIGPGLPFLELFEIDAPENPLAHALFELYEEKRNIARGLPFWREFELLEMVRLGLAKYIFVLEPVDAGTDWRYRLLGTEIVSRFRIDRTGQKFRDFIDPANAEQLIQVSNRIASSGASGFFRLTPRNPEFSHLQIETMSLPIRNNTDEETWLLGGTFYGE